MEDSSRDRARSVEHRRRAVPENEFRKDFTAVERVAIGKAM
jgi:hypothetical protein